MKALIDGDMLTYAIPFTLQETVEIEGEKVTRLKPQAKRHLHKLCDLFIMRIMRDTGATSYSLYINGKYNFRFKVYDQYKANRKSEKPILFEECRQYLIDEHNAQVQDGIESDDALSIEQRQLSSPEEGIWDGIICSLDKDMDQVPGWRYRWPMRRKGKLIRSAETYFVTEFEGLKSLYTQMLAGDTSDNIPGVPGIGAKKAPEKLEGCKTEEEMRTVCEHWNKVQAEKKGTEPVDLDMTYKLLKLLEE